MQPSDAMPARDEFLTMSPSDSSAIHAYEATESSLQSPDPEQGGAISNRHQIVLQSVIDDLAHALQAAIGLATVMPRDAQESANDAVMLEAAIGRAVSALERLQRTSPACDEGGSFAVLPREKTLSKQRRADDSADCPSLRR